MDHILTCCCSSALPFCAVNLVPLAFYLLRIISSHDLKKLKDQHSDEIQFITEALIMCYKKQNIWKGEQNQ
jgi:hypothetical protein